MFGVDFNHLYSITKLPDSRTWNVVKLVEITKASKNKTPDQMKTKTKLKVFSNFESVHCYPTKANKKPCDSITVYNDDCFPLKWFIYFCQILCYLHWLPEESIDFPIPRLSILSMLQSWRINLLKLPY